MRRGIYLTTREGLIMTVFMNTLFVQPIDHFINQQRDELMHLEFDDPEFDRVN